MDQRLIIKAWDSVYLKYSNPPYLENHLLVIPRRHTSSFIKLKKEEREEIEKMLQKGVKLLHKMGHKNVSILVRDGPDAGKSVKHLHYHIIPDMPIGPPDVISKEREVLSPTEEIAKAQKLKKIM